MSEHATTGFLLWRVTMKFRASVDRALADLGLTHAQYSLLASLYGMSRSGLRPSQRELADHTGLEPIFVSKLARALEQAGLLTRDTHPGDPRAVSLALTPRGIEVVTAAVELVQALQQELLAPIGGVGGQRNRELAQSLKALLGAAPVEQRSSDMTSPATILTGQDIGETEGAVRALLEAILAGTGVTPNEYVVLRVLTFRPTMAAPELESLLAAQRQLHLSASDAGALLRGLAEAGLITGLSAGPVHTTELGAARYAELNESVQAVTGRLYGGLDAGELATAKHVLSQIAERANLLRSELS